MDIVLLNNRIYSFYVCLFTSHHDCISDQTLILIRNRILQNTSHVIKTKAFVYVKAFRLTNRRENERIQSCHRSC